MTRDQGGKVTGRGGDAVANAANATIRGAAGGDTLPGGGPASEAAAPVPAAGGSATITGDGSGSALPPGVSGANATQPAREAPARSTGDEADLAAKLRDVLADAIAGTMKIGRESVESFADVYAPRIARVAIMTQDPDPAIAAGARKDLDHLKAQALATAGTYGVALQQRYELSLGAIFETLASAAVRLMIV
jgi:hypothetical protein